MFKFTRSNPHVKVDYLDLLAEKKISIQLQDVDIVFSMSFNLNISLGRGGLKTTIIYSFHNLHVEDCTLSPFSTTKANHGWYVWPGSIRLRNLELICPCAYVDATNSCSRLITAADWSISSGRHWYTVSNPPLITLTSIHYNLTCYMFQPYCFSTIIFLQKRWFYRGNTETTLSTKDRIPKSDPESS